MASVHRSARGDSRFWQAAFYSPDGKRKLVSTKETNRKKALAIAEAWEQASQQAKRHELTEVQARKVLAEILAFSTGETLHHYTCRAWLDEWLVNKTGGASANTITRYKQVTRDFMEHLGTRAEAPLSSITPGDMVAFRDKLRKEGRAATTCNNTVKKILSVPFEQARRLGYIPTNPAAAVDILRDRGAKVGREPFTAEEIGKLLSTAEATPDWRGAIILAVTSGLRLGDIAGLTWACVELDVNLVTVDAQKTGATLKLPIHPDFRAWLDKQPQGIGKAPVFPILHGVTVGGCSGLSAQFRGIVADAGIVGRVVERKGIGRTTNSKTFHALRHTFISSLANAGVASDLRQKLAGHSDDRTHAIYTHHEIETLTAAIAKLPRLATK
ncbi:MAG: site-specific integrase [Verrucomicrobiae bacterium]